MSRTLHYRGIQLGDGVVKIAAAAAPQTPAAILTGLFQASAELSAESFNRLNLLRIYVHRVGSDEVATARYFLELQQMISLAGRVEVKLDATVKMRWDDAILLEAPETDVVDGFGGRWVPAYGLLFAGASSPQWF